MSDAHGGFFFTPAPFTPAVSRRPYQQGYGGKAAVWQLICEDVGNAFGGTLGFPKPGTCSSKLNELLDDYQKWLSLPDRDTGLGTTGTVHHAKRFNI